MTKFTTVIKTKNGNFTGPVLDAQSRPDADSQAQALKVVVGAEQD